MDKITDKTIVKGRFRIKTLRAGIGELLRESEWQENLVVFNSTSGLLLVMNELLGSSTLSLEIVKAKLGTGSTAAADDDVDLETATVDNIQIATKDQTATSAITFTFFAPDGDVPNDTYNEIGIFCDDTDPRLFARAIIAPAITKATNEDLQLEYQILFDNS